MSRDGTAAGEMIYFVSAYRYVPATEKDDREIGHALCGTRCNALSTDVNNITEPVGLKLIQISKDSELIVDLNNPFMTGHCVCIVDAFRAGNIYPRLSSPAQSDSRRGDDSDRDIAGPVSPKL